MTTKLREQKKMWSSSIALPEDLYAELAAANFYLYGSNNKPRAAIERAIRYWLRLEATEELAIRGRRLERKVEPDGRVAFHAVRTKAEKVESSDAAAVEEPALPAIVGQIASHFADKLAKQLAELLAAGPDKLAQTPLLGFAETQADVEHMTKMVATLQAEHPALDGFQRKLA